MKKSKLYIQYTLVIILLFFSCNNFINEKNIKIFRYNESSGVTSLDPIFSNIKSNIWVVNQIFNGLVDLDENLNIIPSIAKDWKISDDNLEYTFFFRDDVFFHKSEYFINNNQTRKVNANDFVYSFSRLKSKKTLSPGRWVLDYFSESESFFALDDTTLVVKLKRPFPSILNILAMKYFSVVPFEVVENTNFSKKPIGTGPFLYKYWKNNVKIVLLKNDSYYESIKYALYLDGFIENILNLKMNVLNKKMNLYYI